MTYYYDYNLPKFQEKKKFLISGNRFHVRQIVFGPCRNRVYRLIGIILDIIIRVPTYYPGRYSNKQ